MSRPSQVDDVQKSAARPGNFRRAATFAGSDLTVNKMSRT